MNTWKHNGLLDLYRLLGPVCYSVWTRIEREFPMAQDIRHPSQPRSVAEVLASVDQMVRTGAAQELIPFPTNFTPLDQVLAGGLRPGDMMLVGGTPGVGKTVVTLQWARN